MEIFTYKDYINSIHTFRLNNKVQLAEEGERYNLDNKSVYKQENEFIKNTLKDKKGISHFFNKYLKPKENIYPKNLIECTNIYKIKDIVVYKIKNKQTYLMIKHQENIDYNISYEVLKNCVNIIHRWKKSPKNTKIKEYPTIIPIIIYTGKEPWNINKKTKANIKTTKYQPNRIDLNYNLIDFNKMKNCH